MSTTTVSPPHVQHVLVDSEVLYLRSMGRLIRVNAIFTDVKEANAHMGNCCTASVIACVGPFILIADPKDLGV